MRLIKKFVKNLLLLVLSERDITKSSFVLRRFFRTIWLLGFVSYTITSCLIKNALRGGGKRAYSDNIRVSSLA